MANQTSVHPRSHPVWELLSWAINFGLALLLAVPAAIVVAILYVVHLIVDERPLAPFFYSGERLGRDKKIFRMYKIRTLKVDPEFEKRGATRNPARAAS